MKAIERTDNNEIEIDKFKNIIDELKDKIDEAVIEKSGIPIKKPKPKPKKKLGL